MQEKGFWVGLIDGTLKLINTDILGLKYDFDLMARTYDIFLISLIVFMTLSPRGDCSTY